MQLGMEERKWEDLNMDCLVNVLGRLEMESLFLDIPLVCKSWYKASLSPLCWRRLVFPCVPIIMHRIHSVYGLSVHFSITKFIKSIINRSNGSAVLLVLPRGCPVDALIYVANECTALKHLALPSSLIPRQYFTIPNLVCKMKNLEMLTLEDSSNLQETLTPVSLHCKNLVGLDFTPGFALVHILEDEASAIVTLLPNIKHLGLRHTFLQRKFLVMILQGCKELVHLDVRNSIGFNVDDEILKLTSHIRTFMYEGSREFIMFL